MPSDADLEIICRATRGRSDEPSSIRRSAAGPEIAGITDQREIDDLEAFRAAGWDFDSGSGTDGGKVQGVLARRPGRGLVVVRDRVIVGFDSKLDTKRIQDEYPEAEAYPFEPNLYEMEFELPNNDIRGAVTRFENALRTKFGDAVRFVEPLVVYHIKPIGHWNPRPQDGGNQWQWRAIDLRGAWRTTRGGNTRIAVIDQGFYEHRTQLKPQVDDRIYIGETGKIIEEPLPQGGHGTFCASLVGAVKDSTLGHGAAPDCRLILVAVSETLTVPGMVAALKICAERNAHIISCSVGPYGGWDQPQAVIDAVNHIQNTGRQMRGVVVVWAVSNSDVEITAGSLEQHHSLLCVGGFQIDGERMLGAFGEGLDLLAPGENVAGLQWNGGDGASLSLQSGTSYAAPCVAGVAALVLSANSDLTWKQVNDIIEGSCDPVIQGKQWDRKVGWGRLHAARAVNAARALALRAGRSK
jgi:subtilisin family serine protease